jgi:hypothetical protein
MQLKLCNGAFGNDFEIIEQRHKESNVMMERSLEGGEEKMVTMTV